MTRTIIVLLAFVIAGCAAINKGASNSLHRYTQSRNLSSAVNMLGRGEPDAAAKILTAIVDSGPAPGITDEALFRLALLSLKPVPEKEGSHFLKRLKNDYPASPWTVQAGPLLELLADVDELRRQNKNYKNQNQSLSKEVNELNENINKLKSLDLELEKKAR
jgi:hypothetical protein